MALVKRGKTWHTHFFVDGQRFRQSLGTSDWREAQAREKELIARASQGQLPSANQRFSKLDINDAIVELAVHRDPDGIPLAPPAARGQKGHESCKTLALSRSRLGEE